jgi:hypothetical protein
MHTTPTHSLDATAQLSALSDDIRQRLATYGEFTETPGDDLRAMLRLTEAGHMSAADETALVMAMLTRETAMHAAELAAHLKTRQELNDLRRSIATEREGLLVLLSRVKELDGGPELLDQAVNGSLWDAVVKH